MSLIIFIEHDGTRHEVDIAEGHSLMEGAVANMVPGIDADCGGACACATCHVHVEPAWLERLPAQSEMEASLLEFAPDPTAGSRLACQIRVSPCLNGMTVHLPAAQH
ncbi:2Fe-2S iron-sulfur cluster-binding protein [Zavarzinia compransoris]|uniref:2Fe-2S ferredoxin n=1 Tax=Zavarzinia compransoris TaxID=1264899 RepID=A0A317E1T0_9PROT|nr:2Fe-2S iron-sulfur cluster-binding protein [Zavarzinia compransoris]PWR21047.1 2Fe-2S ferredoxin [Zavarzinia compransoris]TDP44080.1 2Fe-2S ferredoxin [Zavarzinia compransoris]